MLSQVTPSWSLLSRWLGSLGSRSSTLWASSCVEQSRSPPLASEGPEGEGGSCAPRPASQPPPMQLPLSFCWQSCHSESPHSPLLASLASLWASPKRSTYLTLGGKVAICA
jgi:hypothetical protein